MQVGIVPPSYPYNCYNHSLNHVTAIISCIWSMHFYSLFLNFPCKIRSCLQIKSSSSVSHKWFGCEILPLPEFRVEHIETVTLCIKFVPSGHNHYYLGMDLGMDLYDRYMGCINSYGTHIYSAFTDIHTANLCNGLRRSRSRWGSWLEHLNSQLRLLSHSWTEGCGSEPREGQLSP